MVPLDPMHEASCALSPFPPHGIFFFGTSYSVVRCVIAILLSLAAMDVPLLTAVFASWAAWTAHARRTLRRSLRIMARSLPEDIGESDESDGSDGSTTDVSDLDSRPYEWAMIKILVPRER